LSDHSDSGHGGEEDYQDVAQALGKMKVSEQDAISDESGYSEEPMIVPPIPPAAAAANTMTVLSVNMAAAAAVRTVSPQPTESVEEQHSVSSTGTDGVDHRLEITLTADNCVVSNSSSDNNNTISNGVVVMTSKSCMVESALLQAVRRTSSVFEGVDAGDCLTPPRTPDLSPPLLPATLVMRRPSKTATTTTSPPPLLPRPTDLTVRSVLLSEFSTSEKLRYIERSNLKTGGGGMGAGGGKSAASLLLNRQEFCINI
jgi:hypothetical protein